MAVMSRQLEDIEMPYRHINQKTMLKYAVVLLLAYIVTVAVPVGWGTYFLALPAYIIIILTCLARANNLADDDRISDARRFGFAVMVGMAFLFTIEPLWGAFPKWPRIWAWWALAIIWMTTEGLPPWWQLVSGGWSHLKLLERIKLFIRSLHGESS